MQRRQATLNDLYALGKPARFSGVDDTGEPVDILIYMQKLDPLDHEQAVKKARAARARMRTQLEDPNSDEYLEVVDTVHQLGRERLIAQIVATESEELMQSVRAELMLGEDSEWAKDEKILGLHDAWYAEGGLLEAYEKDPDDPEALRVLEEMKRFEADVAAHYEPQLAALIAGYEDLPDELLNTRATEAMIDRAVSRAWVDEFITCEIWLGTRKPCNECAEKLAAGEKHDALHESYYFANREQVARLHKDVFRELEAMYLDLSVDPTEGKELPGTGGSSALSEQPGPEGTVQSSGRAASSV